MEGNWFSSHDRPKFWGLARDSPERDHPYEMSAKFMDYWPPTPSVWRICTLWGVHSVMQFCFVSDGKYLFWLHSSYGISPPASGKCQKYLTKDHDWAAASRCIVWGISPLLCGRHMWMPPKSAKSPPSPISDVGPGDTWRWYPTRGSTRAGSTAIPARGCSVFVTPDNVTNCFCDSFCQPERSKMAILNLRLIKVERAIAS